MRARSSQKPIRDNGAQSSDRQSRRSIAAKRQRTQYEQGEAMPVELHDGSTIVLRKIDPDYDPTDRVSAITNLMDSQAAGEITTGLLYINESQPEMHELNNTTMTPLVDMPYDKVCPGNDVLQKLQARYR